MPARSNKRQAVVYYVKKHRAPPHASVKESEFLLDKQQGADREVDVVVRSIVGDDPLIVSVEVTDRRSRADVTWVDSQLMKHSHMPTNRLVLVSWSGFTKGALAKVDAQGGRVEAITPQRESIESDVRTKFLQEVRTQPTRVALDVRLEGERVRLDEVPLRTALFSKVDGCEVATLGDLIERLSTRPQFGERLSKDVYDHPDREALSHYTMGNDDLEPLGLEIELGDERLAVLGLAVIGELGIKAHELAWEFWRLGSSVFAMTEVEMNVGSAVYVLTPRDDGSETVSWRSI